MIRPPGLRSATLVLSAAGFIATSTSGASPAVSIADEPKLIWKAETPKVVPWGARISAGKSGKVARSLPASAVDKVNWPPVSCMPSPLSPAKRTTTASGAGWALASAGVRRCVAVAILCPERSGGPLLSGEAGPPKVDIHALHHSREGGNSDGPPSLRHGSLDSRFRGSDGVSSEGEICGGAA